MVLGVAVATFAALAATAHGFPVQHVSLNDGGIWVTDNQAGAVGRFTKPIAELSGKVYGTSAAPSMDVWQNGPVVAAYDASAGKMYAIDAYQTAFSDGGAATAHVPNGVALGGSTLAVLGTDHGLRVTTVAAGGGSLSALDSTAKPLAAHLPANAAVAVGADGTVWVAGGGQLREYPPGAAQPAVSGLPLPASDPMQVTTVGNVPVVADVTTKTLYLPGSGHEVALPATDTSAAFELQQPSGPSGVVVVATGQALYSVDLSTGQPPIRLSAGHSGDVAMPVQVAGCVHAAWNSGSTGSYVRTCGTPPPPTSAAQTFPLDDSTGSPSLVFRVNNDEVVLNDTANGGVFLVDTTVTNVTPKWQKQNAGKNNSTGQVFQQQQRTPVVAKPYTQGVRPGRTTMVHVLDNDSGPAGATLAVTAVSAPDQQGVSVAITPDAQAILAIVGPGLTGDAHFQYTIDDGRGHAASAEVTLVPRAPGQNSAPVLRPRYQPPSLKVASGGNLAIPVAGDWRDFDGDPLYVDNGSLSASAGSVSVTSEGVLSYTAPQTTAGQTVTIRYGVSDGIVARPTMTSLTVSVTGSASTSFMAPQAEPDVVQAIVGSPVTIQPLANDLPGVDPTNPAAKLTLAAPVASVPGSVVSTDLRAGTVTFTARHPGAFFLTYTDAFGAAPTATGTIRVQAVAAAGRPKPPVTTPGIAVLNGQQPAVVDVLADDYDPQGWILGLTGASAAPGYQVAIVDQHWLRISADNPQPGSTATVSYTVSDGVGSATGTVAVTAVKADPNADQISTQDISVVVRAGDSAAVAVLAGDSSSTGLPLSLAGVPPVASPAIAGLLASDQGADVRVVAPARVRAEEETTVSYVATDADGTTATGHLDVTIEPPPSAAHPDQAPVPQQIDTRETAGDIAVIKIPVYGIDPDGDSTAVTAVTVPPALGRIVAIGPDTISYQSYPDSSGTDTFSYQVTDPYGVTGTAQVRVGVLPPGPPQLPVAVDDVINAPPGVNLHRNVLANDFIAPGDNATVVPLATTNKTVPAGVRLAGDYVYLQAPASGASPLEFSYGASDGSVPSLAQVIVHGVRGAKLPPIASDDIAPQPAPGAGTVTVNVLRNDDDPVGSPSDLRISWVPAGVTIRGGSLTIPLTAMPREVPYQVTAPDGLTATAVVDVPGTGTSAIRLKPGARITLKPHGSATVPLSSVLTDAAGRQLKITTVDQLAASPAGDLGVDAHSDTAFQVSVPGGYTGPGAVSVQVYDGASLQDPHGHTATVTIPVQVGPDVPVLRCPQAALQVVEGGAARGYDIGQLCHVWVDTTIGAHAPHYSAGWAKAASGVSASVADGTILELSAASGARPGSTGTLRITPAGASAGGVVNVAVIAAPLPTGRAVGVTADAGHGVTVDLSQYVTSPLAQPDIRVLGVTHPAGATVTTGGSTVTITPGHDTSGTVSLVATATDVAGRADRSISVAITVTVIGHPGTPGTPAAKTSSHTIEVSFSPAAPNGAPVEYYTVYTNGTPHNCPAAPCTVNGLTNGTIYTVYVTAANSVGASHASGSTTAQPNAVPDQVLGLTTAPGDTKVTLGWQPAHVDGTPVTGYEAEISPAPSGGSPLQQLGPSATSTTFTGLVNGTTYTFRVMASNAQGPGPWSVGVTTIPFGKPMTMPAPAATGAAVPNPATTRAITVTWQAAQDNGNAVTAYTVYEYQSSSSSGPWTLNSKISVPSGTSQQSFTVSNNGTWYEYTVTATNAAGESAQSPQSSPAVQGSAPPDQPATPSATDNSNGIGYNGAIHVTFTAPVPNSAQLTSVQYGLNATSESGVWSGPFTAGTGYTESISGLTNGSNYVVYIRGCNDAGLCGPWSNASNQVSPYGPPGAPSVGAVANGTSITFSWSGGGGGGRPISTYHVCIDSNCANYSGPGSNTVSYGYAQTHTITAYVVDSAGQQSGTSSASATTAAAPPATVTVSPGSQKSVSGCTGSNCYVVNVSVANFPATTTLQYYCSSTGSQYWPTSGTLSGGNTNGSGSASFATQCVWGYWNTSGMTISVTVRGGSVSATGSHTG